MIAIGVELESDRAEMLIQQVLNLERHRSCSSNRVRHLLHDGPGNLELSTAQTVQTPAINLALAQTDLHVEF